MGGQYIEAMPDPSSPSSGPLAAAVRRGHWLPRRVPRPCEVCGRWTAGDLCPDCVARFMPSRSASCPRCALPGGDGSPCGACLRDPPPYERCIAVADYGFPWDRLIARFKFEGQPELAALLARALHRALRAAAAPAVAIVLPVPLSAARLAERGYNQAWELARRVAALERVPAAADWLQRLRDTPHQVGSTRAARQRNLHDAMWVTPAGVAGLAGRAVALVDDVLTTGVTAAAAAQALRSAGAASVQVWVLARTPAPAD